DGSLVGHAVDRQRAGTGVGHRHVADRIDDEHRVRRVEHEGDVAVDIADDGRPGVDVRGVLERRVVRVRVAHGDADLQVHLRAAQYVQIGRGTGDVRPLATGNDAHLPLVGGSVDDLFRRAVHVGDV